MKNKMTAWERLNFLKEKKDKTPQEQEELQVLGQGFMLYAKLNKILKGV